MMSKRTPHAQTDDTLIVKANYNARRINALAYAIHELNESWWRNTDGTLKDRNVGELLMLMVSELAEGMEGDRKNLMDDKLPHRKMIEVELADCIIRILDFAGAANFDIQSTIIEKLRFNTTRQDHKLEQRQKPGGKTY